MTDTQTLSPGAFHHATVGVSDLDAAIGFWTRNFGLRTLARREGADATLGRLWGIDPARIRRQALAATPGARAGALHLVEFVAPAEPVRAGAAVYDRLPKNLDLYTTDIHARVAELGAAGNRFRGPPGDLTVGDQRFREVHLDGPDDINVVLIEVLGPGYAVPLSPRGFAGIGPLVTIVGNAAVEAGFLRDTLGLVTTLELHLAGAAVEQTVGLPPGASLTLQVFGDPAEPLGRLEIIEYGGVAGEDRYARARPPARGILHVTWRVPSLGPVRARLDAAGVSVTEHGVVDALFGRGELIECRSPAGLRIELQAAG